MDLSDVERAELDLICSEHIATLVDLKWVLPMNGRTGKATLRGLSLTTDMLDIVRMSPLQWGEFSFLHLVLLAIVCNTLCIMSMI